MPRAHARTRSAEIAAAIEQDIFERGWPVGEMLGSEAQLMERFGASRPVLREAIRTLERADVVRVRTGRGGGVQVAAPQSATACAAASLYLDFVGVGPETLYGAWRLVHGGIIDLAVHSASDAELAHLLALARADEHAGITALERSSFLMELTRLAGNVVVHFFFDVLIDVLMVHGQDTPDHTARWINREHVRMAEALARRDATTARTILFDILERLQRGQALLTRRRPRQT